MSETDLVSTEAVPENTGTPTRRRGLTGMVLAELRQLASELNIPNTTGMRKGDLIAAIKERQSGGAPTSAAPASGQLALGDSGGAEVNGAAPPTETGETTPTTTTTTPVVAGQRAGLPARPRP